METLANKLLREDGRLAVVGSRSTHARSSVRSTSTSGLSFDAMTGGTNWRVCAAQEELARQLFRSLAVMILPPFELRPRFLHRKFRQ